MSSEPYFYPPISPVGYNRNLDALPCIFNVLGYSSTVPTVAEWMGYSVSALAYGFWVSRIIGVARILIVGWQLHNDDGQEENYTRALKGQIVRGLAEIAGLAPILLIADISTTIHNSCRQVCRNAEIIN